VTWERRVERLTGSLRGQFGEEEILFDHVPSHNTLVTLSTNPLLTSFSSSSSSLLLEEGDGERKEGGRGESFREVRSRIAGKVERTTLHKSSGK